MVIDGTTYRLTDIGASHVFAWDEGTTHKIQALQPVFNYDTPKKGYNFTSWTNGNGLVTASGTFVMPTNDVTVTANYEQSTVKPTFKTSGLSKINSGVTILTIDGLNYDIWEIPNFKVQWFQNFKPHSSRHARSHRLGWREVLLHRLDQRQRLKRHLNNIHHPNHRRNRNRKLRLNPASSRNHADHNMHPQHS